ncbi:MAG: hypothetical protein II728_00380, partial [Bacteroidaceae bacterium]|nr:hypothetical protein [Bacteroidaceae bacterium]
LQKSTGNYTLQVGKYRAAFDGLGYSMQQILREAPSALNLNQFFLAISNNIPMFLDQLKAFKQEQAEIAENLKEMTEGTKEYAEQQAKQMSVGKKLLTSILNWQTAVLVVLMILRNLPKIAEWIKKISTKIKETTTYLTELRSAIISINKSVFDSLAAVNVELDEILRRLPNINTGTKEWADNVGRISELTNGLVDANEQNLESIKNTTEEYKKQAEQLAKNKFAVEFIAENVKKQYLVELFSNAGSAEEAARILGITKDQEKEFAAVQEQFQRRVIRNGKTIVNPKIVYADDRQESEWDQQRRRYNYAASFLGLNTQDTIDSVWARYYKAMKTQKESGGNIAKERSFDFSPSEVNDEYWKAEQARIRMMEQGYDMEIDLQKVKHEEMLEQNDIWQGKREEQLMDNLMGELNLLTDGNDKAAEAMFNAIVKNDTEAISQMSAGAQQLATKYWSDIEEGQRQHDLIMQGLILDNNEAIKAINMKYDKERMKQIEEQSNSELHAVRRRVKTALQEQQRNDMLVHNIEVLIEAQHRLMTENYKEA